MTGMLDYQDWGSNDGMWGGGYNPGVRDPGPSTVVDYSQGWPIEIKRKAKSGTEAMDEDLGKFTETHPVPPNITQMAPQSPVGMLAGMPGMGTMPPGVGGNPVPPPQLPPPVNVGAPPPVASVPDSPVQTAAAPPVGAPGPTDVSAQSRGAPPSAPGMPPEGGGPGLLQRFDQWTQRNPSTLLSLAAGFAGAPSFGTGMSRAFGNAVQGTQLDQAQNLKQGQMGTTYRALLKAGVPGHLALAATQNPEIMKKVTEDYLADTKWETKTIKDALGNERLVAVNPKTQEIKQLNGSGATGGGESGGLGALGDIPPQYDPVTRRDEGFMTALEKSDPIAAAAVKDIADGNLGSNGRNLQKYTPYAARYEHGFSPGIYTARNKFNTELGSQTPSSVGGQKVLMGTSLGHLAEAADAAVKLGNVNGLGSSDVASAANWVKNRTTGNNALANSLDDRVAKFSGEVGKLYSGSSGGGVHEREETRKRIGSGMSSEALAAGLEANRDLILSKQQALQQHAEDVFGPGASQKFDFLGKKGRDDLAKIEKSIAQLRGKEEAKAAPAPIVQGKASTGPSWRVITP